MIGNSAVDLDKPGFITVKGKQFKLTKGLWELLTRNDVDTGTIFPNDMQRYKSIQSSLALICRDKKPTATLKSLEV
jgi:hypothetical protein